MIQTHKIMTIGILALVFSMNGAHSEEVPYIPYVWQPLETDPACKYVNSISENPKASRWSGSCSNDFVQGRGELTYNTDLGACRIFGTFTDGIMNGYGETNCWTSRDDKIIPYVYKGAFQNGNLTGYAHFWFGENMDYTGHVVNSQPEGHGKLTDGDITYSGQFKDGQYDGMGIMTVENALTFTGAFVKGLAKGAGVLELHDLGLLRITGYFEGDAEQTFRGLEIVGQGVLEFDYKGVKYNYVGSFKNLNMHGYGVQIYDTGIRHEGMFEHDSREGPGIALDANGNWCEGEWKKGMLDGIGHGLSDGEEKACTMDASGNFTFFKN